MASTSRSGTSTAIAPRTTIGEVSLTTSDIERSRSFYERALGLRATELGDRTVALGTDDRRTLVELHSDGAALPLDHRRTGLFHLAVLVPSRLALAFALARLSKAHWPLDGASDHLVSEALYLSDPDGNGIEIYRDRERAQWRRVDGRLQMATLPLDVRDLAGELTATGSPPPTVAAGTRIGHVHLQVSELEQTEAFYAGVLGFDVTVRGYPGALFVSAGGYHHHVGLNTWQSAGSGPAPAGSVGLRSFAVELPGVPELEAVLARVSYAGLAVEDEATTGDHLVRDPSGNILRLRTT